MISFLGSSAFVKLTFLFLFCTVYIFVTTYFQLIKISAPLGKTSKEKSCLARTHPPLPQTGQLGLLFWDVKTMFCAYDRKNADDDNDDCNDNYDSNDDNIDDNDEKIINF